MPNLVLKLDTNSHDTNYIKKIFRWIRYKNILVFQYVVSLILSTIDKYRKDSQSPALSESQKNMKYLAGILENKTKLEGIMKYL